MCTYILSQKEMEHVCDILIKSGDGSLKYFAYQAVRSDQVMTNIDLDELTDYVS